MKTILTALTALIISANSYAALPLVERNMNIGFALETGTIKTIIFDDGSVKTFSNLYNSETGKSSQKTVTLAKLSKTSLDKLLAKVKNIQNSALVDQDAGQPECMDSPTVSVEITNNSKKFPIQTQAGCHTFVNYQGIVVAELINGLSVLNYE